MNDRILLHHGSGGKLTHQLIDTVFHKHFSNEILNAMSDSAVFQTGSTHLSYTTDSYVVNPLFFPGGNIGKLAVCGTVNDLAVSGAIPMYISAGFIIEEGFSLSELDKIAQTMAIAAFEANVKIVTGDTKVVEKGKCDGLFINTSGIGFIDRKHIDIGQGSRVRAGDVIIVNGPIGEHGISILAVRKNLGFKLEIQSDCAPLSSMIQNALQVSDEIHFMRDATRGGLATVLCELVHGRSFGVRLEESIIPVRDNVKGVCEMFGFDPLYLANEGKVIMVVGRDDADAVLDQLKKNPYGKDAVIIGVITDNHMGRVVMETIVGGNRVLEILTGDQLPRIC